RGEIGVGERPPHGTGPPPALPDDAYGNLLGMLMNATMNRPAGESGAAALPGAVARDRRAAEERANALTHGFGAGLGLVALVLLLRAAAGAGPVAVAAAAVFGGALVLVYLSSALHHGLSHAGAKRLFLLCDRCAIYLLIAGTYTPIAALALAPPTGPALAASVWGLALVGIA